MPKSVYSMLIAATMCGAIGQVFFKLGANGRNGLLEFVNPWILAGLAAYGLSTMLWIFSLSRAPLTVVYPFTALTFVIVYLAGVLVLGEAASARSITGICVVLVGLYLISTS